MKQDLWEANSDSTEEPHKITMSELKQKLDQYYEPSIIHKYSSALDILASFIKSQAFLYNESSNECRYRLNLFMFPCIFLSTMCSVFSSISQQYNYGLLIIGAINALISFLLAIVNYLKLDAAAEAHHISSTHFSRLKILLEFTSGETLLFENPLLQQNGLEKEVEHWTRIHQSIPDIDEERQKFTIQVDEDIKKLKDTLVKNLQEKIDMIREKVIEIRENNRFAIPKRIMNDYPIIYNINIFSFIKTVEDYRLGIISTLKNILNEIHFLGQREGKEIGPRENERILELYERKNNIMNELILLSSTYHLIDIMFQQEIKNNHLYQSNRLLFGLQRVLTLLGFKRNVLPEGYKDPYDCGFIDHHRSLLRKILNL
jgi:hypothetical protein